MARSQSVWISDINSTVLTDILDPISRLVFYIPTFLFRSALSSIPVSNNRQFLLGDDFGISGTNDED